MYMIAEREGTVIAGEIIACGVFDRDEQFLVHDEADGVLVWVKSWAAWCEIFENRPCQIGNAVYL